MYDIVGMGCASYPMRYVPLMALTKNGYISPRWTAEQLESVAKARRVIGFGGSFPPYKALVDKFGAAGSFDEAFHLEPPSRGECKGSAAAERCPPVWPLVSFSAGPVGHHLGMDVNP